MNWKPLALVAALTSGCIVYEDGHGHNDGPDVIIDTNVNYSPDIYWADSGCYWDNYNYDDIWWFEADVDDGNGVFDVVAVYADVYDAYSGVWADSFELYPTNDPYIWFSDWLGSSTYVDCNYGGYLVDIVAYDMVDAFDVYTLAPGTRNYY